MEGGAAQPQLAAVGPEEVHQRNGAAYELAENGGQSGALDTPLQHRHEQSVQHDVGDAGGNGDVQAQLRPFRRHQKALEGVLQHIGDQAQQDDTSVADAHRQHGLVGAQQPGHRREKGNAADGEHGAQSNQHIDQQGEDLVGTLFVVGSQGVRHQRTATGTQHEAHGTQHHEKRHNEVHGSKGIGAHKVGHENTVHHAVDGGTHHHDDRRQSEAQQFSIGEVLG